MAREGESGVALAPDDLNGEGSAAQRADVEIALGARGSKPRMIFKNAAPPSPRLSRSR